MVDITMCANTSCSIRLTCYRYMAKASNYQSFTRFEPYKKEDGWHCEYFMEIWKKETNDGRRKTV